LALSRSFRVLPPRGQPPSPSSDERLPLSTVSLSLRSENVAVVGDEELRRSWGGGDGDEGLCRGRDDGGSTATMLGRLPASDAAIVAGFASVLARLMLPSKVQRSSCLFFPSRLSNLPLSQAFATCYTTKLVKKALCLKTGVVARSNLLDVKGYKMISLKIRGVL
jgi:hypothetical protein